MSTAASLRARSRVRVRDLGVTLRVRVLGVGLAEGGGVLRSLSFILLEATKSKIAFMFAFVLKQRQASSRLAVGAKLFPPDGGRLLGSLCFIRHGTL